MRSRHRFLHCGGSRCACPARSRRCRCVQPGGDDPPHPRANQRAASHGQAAEREEATKTSCSWGRLGAAAAGLLAQERAPRELQP